MLQGTADEAAEPAAVLWHVGKDAGHALFLSLLIREGQGEAAVCPKLLLLLTTACTLTPAGL